MKKFLLFLAVISTAAFFTACEEECEKNNTGDITIQNNNTTGLWFDVTRGDSFINEDRYVSQGSSTTYTMPAGSIKIWASKTSYNEDFFLLKDMFLDVCANELYAPEVQACLLDNTANATIRNNTERALWFDVRRSSSSTNTSRSVSSGSSTTYTMSPGSVDILASYTSSTSGFVKLETKDLETCEEYTYSTTSQVCSLFNLTDITVKNETGATIIIDVYLSGEGFLGSHTVYNGYSHTYSDVQATSAVFWAKYIDSDWNISPEYNLNACQPLNNTWTSGKLNEAEIGDKDLYFIEIEK